MEWLFDNLTHSYSEMDAVVNVTKAQEVDPLPDYAMSYIRTINYAILCGLLSLFGIVTNSVNIIVFVRQGFQDTINISFFALAIADLCSLVALLYVSICYNPFFMFSDLPVLTEDLQYVPGSWTHIIFTRITGIITAFITLERCLCIVYPLKIKNLLTPKRVKIIMSLIYVIIMGNCALGYAKYYFGWKFSPLFNRTMIGAMRSSVYYNRHIATHPFYQLFSFTTVVICNFILISTLNRRSKWRQTASTGTNEQKSTIRDQQVIKMVVYVAAIFIVSFTPALGLFFTMALNAEFRLNRIYANSFLLLVSTSFVFEGFNSSVNIFVYLKTSSKYRVTFNSLFNVNKDEQSRKKCPATKYKQPKE